MGLMAQMSKASNSTRWRNCSRCPLACKQPNSFPSSLPCLVLLALTRVCTQLSDSRNTLHMTPTESSTQAPLPKIAEHQAVQRGQWCLSLHPTLLKRHKGMQAAVLEEGVGRWVWRLVHTRLQTLYTPVHTRLPLHAPSPFRCRHSCSSTCPSSRSCTASSSTCCQTRARLMLAQVVRVSRIMCALFLTYQSKAKRLSGVSRMGTRTVVTVCTKGL
mmetsp:Transcript_55992/g.90685  ORF Transcript_55992/g.90685 Transcript_55992/m.90685 type:complete len:216 (+) Transcript_55992:10-657(+)